MNIERRARTGPPARRASPRIALVALACAAIGLEGCQSVQSINPFRNCCGGGLSRLGGARGLGSAGGIGGGGLFHRRNRVVYDAEPPIVIDSAPGVEILPGAPVIVDPGPVVVDPLGGPDPALITPAPSVQPPTELNLTPLDPLPEPSGRAPQGTINSRANAETNLGARPIGRASDPSPGSPSFGDPYADRMARRSSDEATGRPSLDPVTGPGRAEPWPISGESLRALDSLPDPEAIAPPAEAIVEPGPPPAEPIPPDPALEADPGPPPVAEPDPPPLEEPEVAQLSPTIPEPESIPGTSPGIASFSGVEPHLAGGAVPADDGWAALVDLGYRTVLDLRPVDQIRPADLAASSRHGLRHVLLPMAPGTIDGELVDRFEEEIGQESARPIFFCDLDGSAAAALWFVHRVAVDGFDPERARRDAERIAPIPPALLAAARDYLDGRHAPSAAMTRPAPAVASFAEPAPTEPVPTPEPTPDPDPIVSDVELVDGEGPAAPAADATDVSVAEVFDDPFARPTPIDPKAWGPYAALFLTILVVPLAYWGSSGMPIGLRTRARASLPGPGRRPRSLPTSSDDET